MANYSSNLELAQEISARIGNEPIPFESVSGLCYQIYEELGGTRENYDDVYSILLDILPLTNLIDDTVTTTNKTWSSSKISNEISGVINDTDASTDTTYSSNKIDTLLSGKQGTLIAGQNIIINGNTISAVIDAGFSVEVVQSLPTTGETNTIYFVPISGGVNPDVYDEYMYINNAWEKIGNTSVDLSNYYNKTETDTLLAGKQGTLTASDNINITNNVIKAVGYTYNPTTGAFAEGDRDIDDSGTIRPKPMATGVMAHAEGSNNSATGRAAHAEGNGSIAAGIQSHAEGSEGQAIATNSHAEGRKTITNGYASHTEGDGTETGGNYASATTNTKTPDSRTTFAGDYAHAEGLAAIAYGVASHSEGRKTFAKGDYSHAEGYDTIVLENAAHAEGRNTTVNGYASHAEGDTCETGGNYTSNTKTAGTQTGAGAYAHAEGNATIAKGIAAHSEGLKTFASGNYSHAEGGVTIANGTNSHAEGGSTVANGSNTHAEGRYTQTLQNAEHAQGSYNKSHTDNTADSFGTNGKRTIHSIGIGTADDARKNAVEVMQNGDMYLLGVGGYDGSTLSGNTLQTVINGKQNTLTAGAGISISGNTISAAGIVPDSGYNYATYYKDDDDNIVKQNTATGNYSNWAEGSKTSASSNYGGSHAEGYSTTASGDYGVHSEGAFTEATAGGAHAEGYITIASGEGSHAEGFGLWGTAPNTASGEGSHVEGKLTIAQNNAEHAEGFGNYSHTDGLSTLSTSGKTLSSIGMDFSLNPANRKNAREIMANGDCYIYGIGGYDGRHIKGEVTGTTVYTLQDVITNLLSYTDDLYWQLNEIKPLAPNQIRYTVNDGVEFVTNGSLPIAYTQFNDNNGVGIITYDNDLKLTGNYDFSDWDGQDNITSVELPKSDTLYRISDYCFRGQTNLRQFTIPLNITEIGDCAFEDCSSLEIVKYEGTTTMWGNISFGSNIFANTMITEVYCIDGVVQV